MSMETGQIYIFDVEAGSLTTTYTSHALNVRSLAWSADSSVRVPPHRLAHAHEVRGASQLLLSASEDKRLTLHDVRESPGGTGGAVATFTGHASWVLSVDISQDGKLGLSGRVFRLGLLHMLLMLLQVGGQDNENMGHWRARCGVDGAGHGRGVGGIVAAAAIGRRGGRVCERRRGRCCAVVAWCWCGGLVLYNFLQLVSTVHCISCNLSMGRGPLRPAKFKRRLKCSY